MEKAKLVENPSKLLSKSIKNVIVMIVLTVFVYFGIEKHEMISLFILMFSLLVTTIRLFPFLIKATGDFILVIFEHSELKTLKPTLIQIINLTICCYLTYYMIQIVLERYALMK